MFWAKTLNNLNLFLGNWLKIRKLRYKKSVSVDIDGKTYLSPNCYVAGWGTPEVPSSGIIDPVPIDQLALELHSVNVDIFSRNCLDFEA